MDKFYWNPSRDDLVNIVWQMMKEDGISKEQVGIVIDAFPNQSLDFYGAMRSSVYDAQIRRWIAETVQVPGTADDPDLGQPRLEHHHPDHSAGDLDAVSWSEHRRYQWDW